MLRSPHQAWWACWLGTLLAEVQGLWQKESPAWSTSDWQGHLAGPWDWESPLEIPVRWGLHRGRNRMLTLHSHYDDGGKHCQGTWNRQDQNQLSIFGALRRQSLWVMPYETHPNPKQGPEVPGRTLSRRGRVWGLRKFQKLSPRTFSREQELG
jgi:hypothetical protein